MPTYVDINYGSHFDSVRGDMGFSVFSSIFDLQGAPERSLTRFATDFPLLYAQPGILKSVQIHARTASGTSPNHDISVQILKWTAADDWTTPTATTLLTIPGDETGYFCNINTSANLAARTWAARNVIAIRLIRNDVGGEQIFNFNIGIGYETIIDKRENTIPDP